MASHLPRNDVEEKLGLGQRDNNEMLLDLSETVVTKHLQEKIILG